jgi:hypothetical protein
MSCDNALYVCNEATERDYDQKVSNDQTPDVRLLLVASLILSIMNPALTELLFLWIGCSMPKVDSDVCY